MRVKTLEQRWHGGLPIYACDYQPLPTAQLKKVLAPRIVREPSAASASTSSSAATPIGFANPIQGQQPYRLATGGSDNVVRVWMVHPELFLQSNATPSSSDTRIPGVELLATLSRHTAVVNVVRFSPNGEFIASAGDDGMIAIWAPSERLVHSYTNEATPTSEDEKDKDKEHWRLRVVVRCTPREVYDLAWSPNGEWIVAGSTDNTARVFNASDGTCVQEITEHSHYVQGVAWDPMNEYIATQCSDRSVHLYSITTKRGPFEIHAVGKNSRTRERSDHRHHSRTPSGATSAPHQSQRRSSSISSRPIVKRQSSAISDTESAITTASDVRDDSFVTSNHISSSSSAGHIVSTTPLTPSASLVSTPSATTMFPPKDRIPSRRSSFSGSTAAPSPPHSSRSAYGRSPSPMPPLPAIRTPTSTASWASAKLYGDEGFTNFFRRLTFSPDGGLLLTPAGHFEDPSVIPRSSSSRTAGAASTDDPPIRPKKKSSRGESSSSVFIYSRANFSRPPVAHLSGQNSASVAVKFSPVLYELRPLVLDAPLSASTDATKIVVIVSPGKDQTVEIDIGSTLKYSDPSHSLSSTTSSPTKHHLASPALQSLSNFPSPSLSAIDITNPSTHTHSHTRSGEGSGAVFALPYRMLFAVATQDSVMLYDTQQPSPVCTFSRSTANTSFTDVAWAPDGQSLLLSSSDGYCSVVVFDEYLPLHHTQQHNLQLQSIAQSHSHHSPALPYHNSFSSSTTSNANKERPPLTPAASIDGSVSGEGLNLFIGESGGETDNEGPAKKKRRIET